MVLEDFPVKILLDLPGIMMVLPIDLHILELFIVVSDTSDLIGVGSLDGIPYLASD